MMNNQTNKFTQINLQTYLHSAQPYNVRMVKLHKPNILKK